MPTTSTLAHPAALAITALGPGGRQLLAPLRTRPPAGLRVLPDEPGGVPAGLRCHLLIVVVHLASAQDCHAAAQLPQHGGLGMPVLCITVQPPHRVGDASPACVLPALQALQAHADAHVLVPGDMGVNMGRWLAQCITDMARSLDPRAAIGIDLEDLCGLLREAGARTGAALASAQASGPEKALGAVQQLLAHPFLAGRPLQSARQAAVWITAAPQTFKLREMRDIGQALRQRLHPDATQRYSVVPDAQMGGALRLSALFMGEAMRAAPMRIL